jgi:tRNA-uridine 2-sulfurtransferase
MAKKVLVAVSGGVDSSVVLLILKEQGYDVIAANMKLWDYADVGGDEYHDGRCCSLESINDLQIICNSLSMPFYVFNFSSSFRDTVINDFVSEYQLGRTPNPCILCNTYMKWELFLHKAKELGADYIATGHYAIIEQNAAQNRFILRRGIDNTRDQSYALWGLNQEAMSKTLLPLGPLKKSEVRAIAARHDLKNATKPDSQEICFVPDDNYHRFLKEWKTDSRQGFQPGDIVNSSGEQLGRHNGIAFYTIGQRKGLGISNPTPLYVNRIDRENNRIIVGGEDELFSNKMTVRRLNWISIEPPQSDMPAEVKIRYLHNPASARIVPVSNDVVNIIFEKPQRAITPGQSAVFYNGDIVLGGGLID